MKNEIYQSQTGSQINLYSLIPNNEVKAIIHISHGMVEHALRYKRFANELSKSGYAVYTHDMRGHGQTQALDASQGVFAKSNRAGVTVFTRASVHCAERRTAMSSV